MPSRPFLASLALCLVMLSAPASRALQSRYPYPAQPPDAAEIAHQAWLVTRGMHLRNASTRPVDGAAALLINRVPGREPSINILESHINNDDASDAVEARQLAIFRSGRLRGSGVLLVRYRDPARAPTLSLWLPVLRKVRRVTAPDPADFWSGSTITYGELFLRRPADEVHELLGSSPLAECLESLRLAPAELTPTSSALPDASCAPRGRPVFHLKSTARQRGGWYDYRVSDIDTQSFAPYRSVYYRAGQAIKSVYADWRVLEDGNPRIVYPAYVYVHALDSGAESLVYIPRETLTWNQSMQDGFWSEATLRQIKR